MSALHALPAINPALGDLGFTPRDRLVIFHADDLGMCEATVSAYRDLLEVGLLSSASVMMPCAWSPLAAQVALAHPASDVGVHLTLTSEWAGCRWRPLTCPEDSSLVDEHGFFHATVQGARRTDAVTVGRELRAQLETALAWGLDVTHMDAHMGTAADPRYVREVIGLSAQYGVPMNFPRLQAAAWLELGLDAAQATQAEALAAELEAQGFPLIDHVRMLPLEVGGDHAALTLQLLRDLPPGIAHFILHPARDTPELRTLCPDFAGRVANRAAFASEELAREIRNLGIEVIGYRPLQQLLRRRLGVER